MRSQFCFRMNSSGTHNYNARPEVASAGNVVGSVADDYELIRLKIGVKKRINSACGECRQIATIE